jgi:hypothetical protein
MMIHSRKLTRSNRVLVSVLPRARGKLTSFLLRQVGVSKLSDKARGTCASRVSKETYAWGELSLLQRNTDIECVLSIVIGS